MTQQLESLAVRLRRRRQERGYSQRQLARLAGVSAAYISLIEQGRRAPGADVLDRLGPVLACNLRVSPPHDQPGLMMPAATTAAGNLTHLAALLDAAGLAAPQRALIETLIHAYAVGLIARARDGRPLVTDLAAPWQARILEALQEKMTEDFEQFRDAYLNRLDEL